MCLALALSVRLGVNMTPYICIVSYAPEDCEDKKTFVRINHPGVTPIDVEISPTQCILLAKDLLKNFPIGRIKQEYEE